MTTKTASQDLAQSRDVIATEQRDTNMIKIVATSVVFALIANIIAGVVGFDASWSFIIGCAVSAFTTALIETLS